MLANRMSLSTHGAILIVHPLERNTFTNPPWSANWSYNPLRTQLTTVLQPLDTINLAFLPPPQDTVLFTVHMRLIIGNTVLFNLGPRHNYFPLDTINVLHRGYLSTAHDDIPQQIMYIIYNDYSKPVGSICNQF